MANRRITTRDYDGPSNSRERFSINIQPGLNLISGNEPMESSKPGDIQIKLVQVEFLRAGPPHNQLLSPLTQYLAVSGDSGAGVVSVPYEHSAFERRLKELRYETGEPGDRQAMLHATGVEMGKILGSVPGLPGALAGDPNHAGTRPSPIRDCEGARYCDSDRGELAVDPDAPACLRH
jgi:hypothetical protein